MYYMIGEDGDLEGMILTHVNNFDLAGRKKFVDKVTKEIEKVLDVSTVESNCFHFTVMYVKKREGKIEISIEDYARRLKKKIR